MSNYYSKDLLNSPVINKNIDCSVPCNILLYLLSCCPTKRVNFFPPSSQDLIEIIMILLSATPYPTVFLFLCFSAYFRTSRSVLMLIMLFIENFMVITLKSIIQEPRPNYLCNAEYGYPSNHTCFFTCILFWFICEEIFTPEFFQFKYKLCLIPFAFIYPFILYSRYYLNYHSFDQIVGGFILGFFIGVGWFLLNTKVILCTDNILKEILIRFNIENNLTYDVLYQDDGYILLDEYRALIKKENELMDMKQKLKKVAKNVKNFEGIEELNENYQDILNENFNNKENNYEDDEDENDDEVEVNGEENSDENINEIYNDKNNEENSFRKLKKE